MKSCIHRAGTHLATFSSLLFLSTLLLLSTSACDPSPDFQSLDVIDSSADAHLEDATSDTALEDATSDTALEDATSDNSPEDTSDITPPAIPPQIELTSAPDIFTSETSATFVFQCNQPDCTFECSMNGPYSACESPRIYNTLNNAEYTFLVRALNPEGDRSPEAKHTWTVDTVAPQIQDLTGPRALTNQKTAQFEFGCNETDCTFECALDNASFAPCAAPVQHQGLTDGNHKFSVRATDLAGNTGTPAIFNWTVDTVAPKVNVTSDPENRPYFSIATFNFTCDKPGCTFACSIDAGATFQACTSPKTYENLERRSQSFTVRATDPAGNTGLSTPHTWTVTWPKWSQVAVGGRIYGLMDDGTLWQVDSAQATTSAPVQVESASDWQYIASAEFASCGIRSGRLYCDGFLLGGETVPDSSWKRFTGTNWEFVTLGGGAHACGLRGTDQLWCWGGNAQGQVGSGGGNAVQPVRIGTDAWRSVAAGFSHTCGVTFSSYLYCWGSNGFQQTGQHSNVSTPTRVPPYDERYETVYAGANHTLTITAPLHYPNVFGRNNSGQLGLGNYTETIFGSTQVSINRPTMFAGGDDFSCAVDQDKKVLCSGANDVGQLGRGNITSRHNTFASIKAPNTLFTQVDAGKNHACALDTAGNIWCWGGKAENSTPTKIPWPY